MHCYSVHLTDEGTEAQKEYLPYLTQQGWQSWGSHLCVFLPTPRQPAVRGCTRGPAGTISGAALPDKWEWGSWSSLWLPMELQSHHMAHDDVSLQGELPGFIWKPSFYPENSASACSHRHTYRNHLEVWNNMWNKRVWKTALPSKLFHDALGCKNTELTQARMEHYWNDPGVFHEIKRQSVWALREELNLWRSQNRFCASTYLSLIYSIGGFYSFFSFQASASHSVVPRPAAPTLPGNLLPMHSFRSCPRMKNRGRGQQVVCGQPLLVIPVLNKDYCMDHIYVF